MYNIFTIQIQWTLLKMATLGQATISGSFIQQNFQKHFESGHINQQDILSMDIQGAS